MGKTYFGGERLLPRVALIYEFGIPIEPRSDLHVRLQTCKYGAITNETHFDPGTCVALFSIFLCIVSIQPFENPETNRESELARDFGTV